MMYVFARSRYAASGYDPQYRSSSSRPTFKGSPDPALRLFDERVGE